MPPVAQDISIRRIYVGNLRFETSREELIGFFQEHGVTVHVKHFSAPAQNAHKNSGYAFLTVLGQAQEAAALKLDGADGPGGRKNIRVARAKPKASGPISEA